MYNKIFTSEDLLKRVEFWRMLGDKIVFTNGCFDILHEGHIRVLSSALSFGDRLIVGLNADESVKRLKGPHRPVNSEQSRAVLLAALLYTDAVIIFTEDTPENLIHLIRPDVLVKGGDWNKDAIVGSDFVESYGGEVKTVPYLDGFSTTAIIERSKRP
ncbi:MAG: D-glycero-beta-D-manno-heptose 1-phosphate adenylyltransferase [Chitinophagales bacterium]|nr:D-glycero-beta-D-manno-heptose 1-phosphate adenylyltransferase [Chitinophagales bacterium]